MAKSTTAVLGRWQSVSRQMTQNHLFQCSTCYLTKLKHFQAYLSQGHKMNEAATGFSEVVREKESEEN